MTTTALDAHVRAEALDEHVALYRFDATFVGGGVYYFVQAALQPTGVTFGGVLYTAVDIEFTGLEVNGVGTLPSPKIRVANTGGAFQTLINTYGDLCGTEIRRVRTFKKFLDGQPQADPAAYFGPDVFRVERKANENAVFIEWELSSAIDQDAKRLPGRVVVRDTCLWRYRVPNGAGGYDYSRAQCPYTGSAAYDLSNNPTTAANDACARSLSACRLRFGPNVPLPFGGFPGVSRVRQ